MFDSILDFFRNLPVEREVHPGIDIANVFVIIVLLSAFGVAFGEYRGNRRHDREEKEREENRAIREERISRESSAKELYRDYLRTALEYPKLSAGNFDKEDSVEVDRYDTFLSIMLYSFDEGVNYTDGDFYDPIINWQIRVHEDYIRPILTYQLC